MVDHAVNDAGGDEKTVIRSAEAFEFLTVFIGRLRQNGNAVTCIFQRADNDSGAEGRVIDVGVAADIDKVRRVPASFEHIPNGCRGK